MIEDFGFFASTNSRTDIYQFFASWQGETGEGDVHIHLGIVGTERYEEFIILRDYLLSRKDEAQNYKQCKIDLIEKGITDRRAYRAAKSEYVTKLIARAKENLQQNKNNN